MIFISKFCGAKYNKCAIIKLVLNCYKAPYGGREGHWTRFHILNAIHRSQMQFTDLGRDSSISDAIHWPRTWFIDLGCDSPTSDAIHWPRTRFKSFGFWTLERNSSISDALLKSRGSRTRFADLKRDSKSRTQFRCLKRYSPISDTTVRSQTRFRSLVLDSHVLTAGCGCDQEYQ